MTLLVASIHVLNESVVCTGEGSGIDYLFPLISSMRVFSVSDKDVNDDSTLSSRVAIDS